MARYFRLWSIALLSWLFSAVGLNYWVDPYGLYRVVREGDWKPHAATQGALVKPYQVLSVKPRTLVLGNSRAEVGFDPDDAAWPDACRPVYNLALPGTDTRVARRLFEYVLAAGNLPELVVLGVDFMDFLVEPDATGAEPLISERLSDNGRHWLSVLHDGAITLASLDALIHSVDTLRVRGQTDVAHLTAAGFNPMHDYRRFARQEGYFVLFRQKDIANLQAYRRRPKNLFVEPSHSSPAFDDVSAILRLARDRRIPVRLVIYPYHGHLLEIIRITGLWPLFEEWKRELTRLTAVADGSSQLWDFSGYHAFASEPVPARGDRNSEVHGYWEAGHFKSALGHLILLTMQSQKASDFGALLTPDHLEERLSSIRRAGELYRRENAAELSELEDLGR